MKKYHEEQLELKKRQLDLALDGISSRIEWCVNVLEDPNEETTKKLSELHEMVDACAAVFALEGDVTYYIAETLKAEKKNREKLEKEREDIVDAVREESLTSLLSEKGGEE